MRIYVAPLFTEADRAFNLVLAHVVEADGHQVYLPQRDIPELSSYQANESLQWDARFAAPQKEVSQVREWILVDIHASPLTVA